MKTLRCLLVLFLLLVSVLAKRVTPGNASPFEFFKRGDRTSTGTYNVEVTAPFALVKPASPVKFCESASTQTLVFETEDYGTQWVTPDGYFYEWLNGPEGPIPCAANTAFNITLYQQNYAQVVQVFVDGKLVGFSGAVMDPGQLGTFSSAFFLVEDQILEYVLAGSVYNGEVIKTIQRVFLDSFFPGLHDCPPLPPACLNPTSYNVRFAPKTNAAGETIIYDI